MASPVSIARISKRGVYRRADLARLISPRSIALVGASPTAGSIGDQTLKNLEGYEGRIYLVNSRHGRIADRECFPSVLALPEAPDCAIVAVPRSSVEGVIEECIAKGARGAIVYASGYAETGKDGADLQARLSALSGESRLHILGPNCIGLINHLIGFSASFSRGIHLCRPRGAAIGVVSQSGALGIALTQASRHGTSFSHMLAAGNSADVDIADLIAYLADEPGCHSIALVIEGTASPERLLEAGEVAAAADKPVVVFKLAKGTQGASVAMSHTGQLAGSSAAYRAAFERAGMIVVERFEDIVQTAAFFAKAPRPKAFGVAVATVSGGQAIMAADEAELQGVELLQPNERVCDTLQASIPDFGSARNPCDLTGAVTANPASFRACVEAFYSDPGYGALVVPHHNASPSGLTRLQIVDELASRNDKMACAVWNSGWLEGPGAAEAAHAPRLALFHSMECCFKTLALWHRRELRRAAGARTLIRRTPAESVEKASALLARGKARALAEHEAKEILSHYGIPVVPERLVNTEKAAVEAAKAFGWPVVLKAVASDLPHKTEAGAIRLNLKSEAEVRSAFASLIATISRLAPAVRIDGILVQPMIETGVEVMVGARVDRVFGPLVVVGLGGAMVELFKDSAVSLAPVTAQEALAMLRSLKGSRLLSGFRGSPKVDLDRVADAVCRISEFAADQRERFEELDVNPLICAREGITAVDALIVRRIA